MRKLSKAEIKSLGNMCIQDKENLLPKSAVKRIKKMPSYKKATRILDMDVNTREKIFGVKGNEGAYNKAWTTWHKLFETAIKRHPAEFIGRLNSEKLARKKYTKEDVELFRDYIYNNEIDSWIDEGYGVEGGKEKAEHWLKARRKTILDEIFWLFEPNEIQEFLKDLKDNNE